jgi:hypothetical protein
MISLNQIKVNVFHKNNEICLETLSYKSGHKSAQYIDNLPLPHTQEDPESGSRSRYLGCFIVHYRNARDPRFEKASITFLPIFVFCLQGDRILAAKILPSRCRFLIPSANLLVFLILLRTGS